MHAFVPSQRGTTPCGWECEPIPVSASAKANPFRPTPPGDQGASLINSVSGPSNFAASLSAAALQAAEQSGTVEADKDDTAGQEFEAPNYRGKAADRGATGQQRKAERCRSGPVILLTGRSTQLDSALWGVPFSTGSNPA